MTQSKEIFELHIKSAWKNPKSLAICFLIAYDELLECEESQEKEDLISKIPLEYLNLIRYYIIKTEQTKNSIFSYEQHIFSILNEVGYQNLKLLFKFYKKKLNISNDSDFSLFFN